MTTACLMSTYQPLALSFTRGLGTRLWDQSGREYLDAVAGVAVTNVGHSHPLLVDAIRDQAGLLLHTSNLYSIDWQQRLAQKLTELAGMDRVFFNNSGAEANETALKLARCMAGTSTLSSPWWWSWKTPFTGARWARWPPATGQRRAGGAPELQRLAG